MKQFNNSSRRGFTLIEILIVIAILGFLFSLGVLAIASQQKKARDARRRTDIHELQVAIEGYYTDHGRYPDQLPVAGQPLVSVDGQTVYLGSVPRDPKNINPNLYVYNATPSGQAQGYDICAYELEAVPDDRTPGKDESFCLTNRQ